MMSQTTCHPSSVFSKHAKYTSKLWLLLPGMHVTHPVDPPFLDVSAPQSTFTRIPRFSTNITLLPYLIATSSKHQLPTQIRISHLFVSSYLTSLPRHFASRLTCLLHCGCNLLPLSIQFSHANLYASSDCTFLRVFEIHNTSTQLCYPFAVP